MDASRSKPSQPSPRTLAPSPATQGRRGFCGGAAALSFAAAVPARAVPPIDCNSFGCAPAVQRGAGTPPAPVTTVSSPRALRVAAALEKKGIALYGAYWCGYCEKQRNVLGAKAAAMVTYVECDRDGRGFAGAPACAGVQAYPTWAGPDGQRVEGKLSLAQLEQLAGIETRPADAAADAKAAAAPAPVRNAKAPIVQGPSSAQALVIAAGLKKSGAQMFGTFWCPFCDDQRQLFGKDAWRAVADVECDSRGAGFDGAACTAAGVGGIPAWVIPRADGSAPMRLEGFQTLVQLEAALKAAN